jgi:hypothetical protein
MDVARDARWGRVTETYGEDPYLVSAMSVAFTRGMQGKDVREGVLVCAKHFLGYAVTEGGQNMAATAIGPRELYDVYARPYITRVAVIGPHADSTMVGFPHYTYQAALPMLGVAVKLGMFPMPGVGEVLKEGMAALQAELASTGDVEQYARKEYGAVSLAEAVRKLLPGAQVTAYYGGPHQGPAIADAIFGVTNPGGKLPITIPRHVGQVPIHHGQRNGSGYR